MMTTLVVKLWNAGDEFNIGDQLFLGDFSPTGGNTGVGVLLVYFKDFASSLFSMFTISD